MRLPKAHYQIITRKGILPDCWDLARRTVEFTASEESNDDIHMILSLEGKGRRQEAAELLAGDFIEGLYLEDNAEFETWQFAQRENWRERTDRIYSQFIEEQEILGRYKQALEKTRRLLGLTPWDGDAHRRAMRLLVWMVQEQESSEYILSATDVIMQGIIIGMISPRVLIAIKQILQTAK